MKNNNLKIMTNGIVNENPLLVSLMGICPALAISTSVKNALYMGIVVISILILTNFTVSIFRNVLYDKIRIPVQMIIIAGYVTIAELLLKAFLPEIEKQVGFYISLVVVNCLILYRSEVFALNHNPLKAIGDGISFGVGYTTSLLLISSIREILGKGTFFDIPLFNTELVPTMAIMTLPAGGLLIMGLISALVNKIRKNKVN